MATTIAIFLVSLLSAVIQIQSQDCQLAQVGDSRQSEYDLTSHALVQTISPIVCAPAIYDDAFSLSSFRVVFAITTGIGIKSMDLRLVIFFPDPQSAETSALLSFDPMSAETNILFEKTYHDITVNVAGTFPFTFLNLATEAMCPANLAIFINITRVGEGITSIKMWECSKAMDVIAAPSTLKYYSFGAVTNTMLGLLGSSSTTFVATGFGLKLPQFNAISSYGYCSSTSTNCGDGTINGMCIDVYTCLDSATPTNPQMLQQNSTWVQFINAPSDCADGVYIYGMAVYLQNLTSQGYMMRFTMELHAVNGDIAGITPAAIHDGGVMVLNAEQYIDDVMVSQNSWDGFYEMYFGFASSTAAIYGTECSDGVNCQFYWQLTLIYNDREMDNIGIGIVGCIGESDELTFNSDLRTVYESDVYNDGVTDYTQFDIAYRIDAGCSGSVVSPNGDICEGETSYYVNAVIVPEPDYTISQLDWKNNMETVKMEGGYSFLNAVTYNVMNTYYCFDYWNAELDCGCVGVESLEMYFDADVQFLMRFKVNSDIYELTLDEEWDVTKAQQYFANQLSNSLATYNAGWFDSEVSFSVSFEIEVIESTISDESCPSTAADRQITIEFAISTDILSATWISNLDQVSAACIQTLINVVKQLYGETLASRCFSVTVSVREEERRRMAATEDTGIALQIEIDLKEDIYDEIFADISATEFGDDFMAELDVVLTEYQTDDTIDWYTDDSAQYTLDSVTLDTAADSAKVDFVNFKEDPMQIGITGVLALAATIGIFGYLNSLWRGADNFRYTAVFFFGLYTWDFFSDVFFSALLYTSKLRGADGGKPQFWIIFLLSVAFIVVPVLLNFRSLLRSQGKWQEDKLHSDRYRAWLSNYANVLFFLSFLSGSTFGAIALVNSNLLGLRLFAMGLSNKDMREFDQQRLYNVVLGENLPQLLLQIAYTYVAESFELIAFLAICSSSISIAAAVYSFQSTKKVLALSNVQESLFSLKVSCLQTEFLRHPGLYKNKTYYLSAEIARIFPDPLDRSCVEILPTQKFSNQKGDGLMIYFFISTSKRQPAEIYEDLKDAIKIKDDAKVSHLGRQIAKSWNLEKGEECDAKLQVKTFDLVWMNCIVGASNDEMEMQTVGNKTNTNTNTENVVAGESGAVNVVDNVPLAVDNVRNSMLNPADFELINVDPVEPAEDADEDEGNQDNDDGDGTKAVYS